MTDNKKITPAGTDVIETKSRQIISQPQDITTFDPQQQVEYAQKAAKALMTIIKANKPLVMNGKQYLYFEHWQTVAKFFNTTVGIESTSKDINGYIAKAVVYDKNGVVIGGAEASCMKDETNWKSKPDFQLRSMAQTRAMAKALRSIYGFVAILAGVEGTPAEEMQDTEYTHGGEIVEKPNHKKPTEKQNWLIKKLCRDKHITQEMAIEMAKGKTPSEFIKILMEYQSTPEQKEVDEIANQVPF